MTKLFQWVDKIMIRSGRKLLVVDWKYNIIVYKYCLLFKEKQGDFKWFNIYIHNFVDDAWTAEETTHSHGGDSYSFVLKGGYTEQYDNRIIERTRFSFNRVKYPLKHRIVSALPNTWTIFAVGPRKQRFLNLKTKGDQTL